MQNTATTKKHIKTLSEVRKSFLEFFKSKGHEIISSSPLLPHNDPTLMFTNAGMVQFKNVFVGKEELKGKASHKVVKAATVQKCVRAGGKHNDLDNVGYTARHHTFFEMLGNFSFGDYFKEQAISYAWEYLTRILEIPKEKLLVTVYHTDDEAFNIWKKVAGLTDEKIIRIASDDNFWAMGETGPCGPCSEIFYDHGPSIAGGPPGSVDQDGDRFIEIWNLVFMQYEKHEDGSKTPLPKPCIDTGMGLERITSVLQNIHDNYETDLFTNLIESSKQISRRTDQKYNISHRVIADHLRSTCFLIADGISPSNEGRGYVLRRIMRRAMRHCHILDSKNSWFYKLVPALIENMGQSYPELIRAEGLITQTLKNEEEKFRETLGNGIKILDAEIKPLKSGGVLAGDIAFKLYDTYGFPLDLTQDILRAKNISVDTKGFEIAMEKQRDLARSSWAGSGEQATSEIWLELAKKGSTEFLGYSNLKSRAEIISILNNDAEVKQAKQGENAIILTNQTPFYGESGGQAGDKGIIYSDKFKFEVDHTRKFGGLHAHFGRVISGEININTDAYLEVNKTRRDSLKRNHSATHILHAVLRNKLGDQVTQKGSLVEEDYLRFDFSHNKSVTKEELLEIEKQVNKIIVQNAETTTRVMAVKQAMEVGAVALFGEKYGDEVRVVSMGLQENNKSYSIEFCGGTHVERTGDIGLFKIIKESAIASGVRRIEAVTADKAIDFIQKKDQIFVNLQEKLKTNPEDFENRISTLMEERKNLEQQISDLKKKLVMSGQGKSASDSQEAENIKGISYISKKLEGIDSKDLRSLIDEYKKKYENAIIVLIADNEGKASVACGVADNISQKISATDIVKKVVEILGGKGGGGRPDFAQGGAQSSENSMKALDEIKELIASIF
jgi:alanyl-tRNA synthetase